MIAIEFPVVYTKNYDERVEASQKELPLPDAIEEITKTIFYISDKDLLRVSPIENNRSIIDFMDIGLIYTIDADYESVNIIIQRALKINQPNTEGK